MCVHHQTRQKIAPRCDKSLECKPLFGITFSLHVTSTSHGMNCYMPLLWVRVADSSLFPVALYIDGLFLVQICKKKTTRYLSSRGWKTFPTLQLILQGTKHAKTEGRLKHCTFRGSQLLQLLDLDVKLQNITLLTFRTTIHTGRSEMLQTNERPAAAKSIANATWKHSHRRMP